MRQRRNLNIDTNVPSGTNPTITPYANKNYQDYFLMDANKPLISPINYHPHMFPVSTKNHFNINMDQMLLHNLLETPTNFSAFTGSFRMSSGGEAALLNQTKEVSMQDKILINEPENNNNNNNNYSNVNKSNIGEIQKREAENINFNTPKFKVKMEEAIAADTGEKELNLSFNVNEINNINNKCAEFDSANKSEKQTKKNLEDTVSTKPKDSSSKRFSLDLDVVNQSDTTKIFSETVNNYKNEPSNKMRFSETQEIKTNSSPQAANKLSTKSEEKAISAFPKTSSKSVSQQEHKKVIFSTVYAPAYNITKANAILHGNEAEAAKAANSLGGDKMEFNKNLGDFCFTENTAAAGNELKNKIEFLKNKYNKIIPMISPSKASLNISPKSAFVVNKKLFN